jgi:hypothetical protein
MDAPLMQAAHPPARTRDPRGAATAAGLVAGAAAVIAITWIIYGDALFAYFADDDFGWLSLASAFRPANLVDLGRYSHFYRPLVELYFAALYRVAGCEAWPYHAASLTIHVATVLTLYAFARTLGTREFAAMAALMFAVLPGHTDAVTWVAAITDLMPAFWYVATLWLHLRFLGRGRTADYVLALGTYTACLLTHEIASTLLPMMVLLELAVEGRWTARRIREYVPFAALLVIFLVVAYVVNSRNYLVLEGHYRIGWHAVPHILEYLVSFYVGRHTLVSYAVVGAVVALLLARGTPRVRFFVAWMLITLLPASFFTWGNVSRYGYLPAAGFALLLAETLATARRWSERLIGPRAARLAAVVLVGVLAVRFSVFARKEAGGLRAHSEAFRTFVASIRRTGPTPPPEGIVYIDRETASLVAEATRDQAAQVAFCSTPVHVVVR